MSQRVSGKVYMRLTVEVDVGSWGGEQDFNSLYPLAQREAVAKVRSAIANSGRNDVRLVDTHNAEMKVHIEGVK